MCLIPYRISHDLEYLSTVAHYGLLVLATRSIFKLYRTAGVQLYMLFVLDLVWELLACTVRAVSDACTRDPVFNTFLNQITIQNSCTQNFHASVIVLRSLRRRVAGSRSVDFMLRPAHSRILLP